MAPCGGEVSSLRCWPGQIRVSAPNGDLGPSTDSYAFGRSHS